MKKLLFVSYCLFQSLFLSSEESMVKSKVDEVIVYHSGALVKRSINTPIKPGVSEITLDDISPKILLNTFEIKSSGVRILSKAIIKKLSTQEYQELLDKKESLTKQLNLLEAKHNETGFIKNAEDLQTILHLYQDKLVSYKKQIREIDNELNNATLLSSNQNETTLVKLTIQSNKSIEFEFQYICGGIGWSPAYELTASDASKKEVTLRYFAKAMNQSGENWENIHITFSSAFPLESTLTLPQPDKVLTLENGGYNYNYTNNTLDPQKNVIEKLEGIDYQNINIPTVIRPRKLTSKFSFPSNSTVFQFTLNTVRLTSNLYYYGFPELDAEPYLVAQITGFDTLGFIDGYSDINLQGENIGKTILRFSENPDTLVIPLSKDNGIFLSRKELTDQKQFESGNLLKDSKATMAYKFQVKNNKSIPVQFELHESIPVSQSSDMEVDFNKTSGGKIDKQNAEIVWHLDLKPFESLDKELVYSISGEIRKSRLNRKESSTRYKTISCPSF